MNILKVFPAIYPVAKNQHASIVTAALPYVEKSKHNIKIVSSYTDYPLDNKKLNIIYVSKKDCMFEKTDILEDKIWNVDYRVSIEKYNETLLKIIEEEKPDLIEVEFDPSLAGYLSKNVNNIPVALVNHITLVKSDPIKNLLSIFTMNKIAGFIFVSNYFKRAFARSFPFYKHKSYVVHNSYEHILPYTKDTTKKDQIIFVGRGTTRKGIKEYLQAVSTFVNNQHNSNWNALAICSIENEKERVTLDSYKNISSVKQAIDTNKLKILENLPNQEAYGYLLESKIAVFPTTKKHKEGIPMVALEAALAKCLMITSTSGGFLEINPFPRTIIKKVNVKNILYKLNLFTQHPDFLHKNQQSQYEYVRKHFNVIHLVEIYDRIRENIVERHKTKHRG